MRGEWGNQLGLSSQNSGPTWYRKRWCCSSGSDSLANCKKSNQSVLYYMQYTIQYNVVQYKWCPYRPLRTPSFAALCFETLAATWSVLRQPPPMSSFFLHLETGRLLPRKTVEEERLPMRSSSCWCWQPTETKAVTVETRLQQFGGPWTCTIFCYLHICVELKQ